jgi:exodeoxyribonuclease VII large subunit
MFEAQRTRLDRGRDRLRAAPALLIERRRAALDRTAARLQALSPKATLARGYAIVRTRDGVLRDAALATPGARIDVELARGGLGARVEDVRAR